MTKEELKKLDKVAIRFTADWCNPCKLFAPTFDKVAAEFQDSVSSVSINVGTTEGQDLAKEYGVLGIPAVVFVKQGNFFNNMAGNQPTEVVRKKFEELKNG